MKSERSVPRLPLGERLRRRAIGVGMRVMFTGARLRHALGGRDRLRSVDHLTLPCADLEVAEAFYVGLLGARVAMRVDAAFLARFGRPAEEAARGLHLTVVLDGGPRIDLFRSAEGVPPATADHPHLAFWVAPSRLLAWRDRLAAAGVPTDGPRRLGPPGQASLYFLDPFGNHLELTTMGFDGDLEVSTPELAGLVYTWRGAAA